MDERTLELLSRLGDCSAEELDEALAGLNTAFEDLDGQDSHTPETAAAMKDIVENAEKVKAEKSRRVEAAAQAEQEAEELRTRMAALKDADPEGGEEGEGEGEGEGSTTTGQPAEGEGEGEQGAQPEGIAASGSRVGRMRGTSPGAVPGGSDEGPTRVALVASGGARGTFAPDHVFDDMEELGLAIAEQLNRMPKSAHGRGGEPAIVASARYDAPTDVRLLRGDPYGNLAKMTKRIRSNGAERAERRAIAASGGIPGPPTVDYSIPVFATAERPLKGGLNSTPADRGALMYVTPPDFGVLAGATVVWPEATDLDPGDTTKPVEAIGANSLVTVYVDAIPTRIGAGNMEGRFAPEWVAANTELALAAAAQVQELNLLAKIDAAATAVTSAKILGTSRDLLTTADLVVAAYRDRHRISDSQAFTAVFPRWAKGLFRVDIARELAHDTAGLDPRAVSDSQIESWLGARGITPIWMLDGSSGQTFGAQSAGAVDTWPTTVIWRLFVEGTWQHLDGGSLDLGVVRDSTLDATNDYETFVEIFETLANRGVETLKITSTVRSDGSSSGTVTPTTSQG